MRLMTSAVIMLALLCFIQLHRKSEPMVEVTFSGRNFVCHQLNATNSNNLECYLAARIRSLFLVFLTNPDDILSPLKFLLPFSCIKWHPKLSKARRAKLNGQALVISGCHLKFVVFFLNNLIWHPQTEVSTNRSANKTNFFFLFFSLQPMSKLKYTHQFSWTPIHDWTPTPTLLRQDLSSHRFTVNFFEFLPFLPSFKWNYFS